MLEELYEEVVVELLVELYGEEVVELSVALDDVDQVYEVLNEEAEVVFELGVVEDTDLVVELVVEVATGDDVVD